VSSTDGIESIGEIHFQVAPGDACQIDSAAVWHEQISEQMGTHARSISDAADASLGKWDGEAAAAYKGLAHDMVVRYEGGQARAGATAQMLRAISAKLRHCQEDGTHALNQAEHWVEQATKDYSLACEAKARFEQAEADYLKATEAYDNATRSQPTGTWVTNPSSLGSYSAAVTEATTRLHRAEAEFKRAAQTLHDDNLEIGKWDRRGEQAWDDALDAVQGFTGLPAGPIPTPPMPGIPVPAPPPPESIYQKALHITGEVLSVVSLGASVLAMIDFWNPTGAIFAAISASADGANVIDEALAYQDDPDAANADSLAEGLAGLGLDGESEVFSGVAGEASKQWAEGVSKGIDGVNTTWGLGTTTETLKGGSGDGTPHTTTVPINQRLMHSLG
jgi:hypothetical protein